MNNLDKLHEYSVELGNTLNQLSTDLNDGRIKWGELSKEGSEVFAEQTSNISKNSFSNLEENFHKYSGLIYDGAFSEHITSAEKKGLTGENINEEKALDIAKKFIGEEKIQKINFNGKSENGNIVSYDFSANLKQQNRIVTISISEKGGHIVYMNSDRNVNSDIISEDDANKIGKKYLSSKGFENMKETYYLKENGIVTINYAYLQDNVTIYPDLIKLKIALDNGEVLGMETEGYLNNHTQRTIETPRITSEEAKASLNKNLNLTSEGLAIIPTEWRTENFCYEFKGKVDDTDFLVYVNALTGEEEDILVIINTPDGILTQ